MTAVYLDDGYQSVAEKTHPQNVPGGEAWTALRWINADGTSGRDLKVQRAGPQDYDYSGRIDAQDKPNLVWLRVQRYPIVAGDNGTHWQGPFATVPGEPFYFTGGTMDRQNGAVGKGYGTDIKLRNPARVSVFIAKLDPRR